MQGTGPIRVLAAFALLLCLSVAGKAEGPVQISGGLSPNGKIAVVVKRDEDTSQDSVSSDNEHPLLQDVTSGKIIGPLEEIDTMGGGFGHVLDNVTAFWGPDDRFLAVRFRAGRLAEDFVIYRITRHGAGYRAIPQKLPDSMTGPNGVKIFAHASHAANMGAMFKQWTSPTEFTVQNYRYFPPYPPASADVDFFNGDGLIEVVYAYKDGGWRVAAYKKPPESVTN